MLGAKAGFREGRGWKRSSRASSWGGGVELKLEPWEASMHSKISLEDSCWSLERGSGAYSDGHWLSSGNEVCQHAAEAVRGDSVEYILRWLCPEEIAYNYMTFWTVWCLWNLTSYHRKEDLQMEQEAVLRTDEVGFAITNFKLKYVTWL